MANLSAKLPLDLVQKNMILKALMSIATVFFVGVAVAQPHPVIGSDTLLCWLTSSDERDGALATGYIGGVREATYQKEHCASGNIKVLDVIGAVRRTLDGLPEYRKMPASWTVIAALNARWPCPDKVSTVSPQTTPNASPPSGDSSKLANWRALRKGMTEAEVKALLGEPLRVEAGGFTYWYWDRNSNVIFFLEKLHGWNEPR